MKTAALAQDPVLAAGALPGKGLFPVRPVPVEPALPDVDEGSLFYVSFDEFPRHARASRDLSVMQDASDQDPRGAVVEFVPDHALPFRPPVAFFTQIDLHSFL